MKPKKIAIAGIGTVGKSVMDYLISNKKEIAENCNNIEPIITNISSRTKREYENIKWQQNPLDLLQQDIDILIELIGGADGIAYELVKESLQKKIPVITANKALLAKHGNELFDLAKKNNTALYFEAAVAAGIPIIKIISSSLRCNKISNIYGILNGTCNFILSKMENDPTLSFADVLQEAQDKGFAEAEPSLDIDGFDASHKIILLSSLAYKTKISTESISVRGIRDISNNAFSLAKKLGFKIRLLAKSSINNKNKIYHSVFPYFIKENHFLGNINDALNSIYVKSDLAKDTILTGHGAGGEETASSVIADLYDILCDNKFFIHNSNEATYLQDYTEQRNLIIIFSNIEDYNNFLKHHNIIEKYEENLALKFSSTSSLMLELDLNNYNHSDIFEIL